MILVYIYLYLPYFSGILTVAKPSNIFPLLDGAEARHTAELLARWRWYAEYGYR